MKVKGFLKSSEVRPTRKRRRLLGCVTSRALAGWRSRSSEMTDCAMKTKDELTTHRIRSSLNHHD